MIIICPVGGAVSWKGLGHGPRMRSVCFLKMVGKGVKCEKSGVALPMPSLAEDCRSEWRMKDRVGEL